MFGAGALALLGAILLAEVWLYGPIAGDMGGWPAPFGITLVADLMSALMVLTTGRSPEQPSPSTRSPTSTLIAPQAASTASCICCSPASPAPS